MYKAYSDPDVKCVLRYNEDGSITSIPTVEANSDYQRYLAWLADGNEPQIIEG